MYPSKLTTLINTHSILFHLSLNSAVTLRKDYMHLAGCQLEFNTNEYRPIWVLITSVGIYLHGSLTAFCVLAQRDKTY